MARIEVEGKRLQKRIDWDPNVEINPTWLRELVAMQPSAFPEEPKIIQVDNSYANYIHSAFRMLSWRPLKEELGNFLAWQRCHRKLNNLIIRTGSNRFSNFVQVEKDLPKLMEVIKSLPEDIVHGLRYGENCFKEIRIESGVGSKMHSGNSFTIGSESTKKELQQAIENYVDEAPIGSLRSDTYKHEIYKEFRRQKFYIWKLLWHEPRGVIFDIRNGVELLRNATKGLPPTDIIVSILDKNGLPDRNALVFVSQQRNKIYIDLAQEALYKENSATTTMKIQDAILKLKNKP
jgi:hypothetical protein